MTQVSYDNIAEWYDQLLRERPVYTEVILPNLWTLVSACIPSFVGCKIAQVAH